MKIGIDGRCLMEQLYSGVPWYTYNIVKELINNDYKNEYKLFLSSWKNRQIPQFDKHINTCYFKQSNKLLSLNSFFKFLQFDKKVGGVDIFWAPNINFINVSSDCKLILTIHDLSFLIYKNFLPLKKLVWHNLILKSGLIKRADIIISDSQSTKNDLVNLLKISDNRIKVVYPGISAGFKILNTESESILYVKAKYNLPDKYILFLGSLEPRKNIQSLLSAFKLMSTDYKLVIAGSGGWKNKEIFESAKNDSRVKMIGYVDEKDKPALYNLAKLFIYPSFYEGFGLPPVEAMACGCPVIVGANSSQAEIVGDNGLLIDVYNINEIKKSMEILISENEIRKHYIEKGLKKAQEFTWHKTAKQMMEIFNES